MPSISQHCPWASNDVLLRYHDAEWGRPVHDDRTLFEFLILEGAQAGLSWETILKKRDAYRDVFENFDAAKIARFTDTRLGRILENPGIVRNRLKVFGARTNARAVIALREEWGSFDRYLWRFAPARGPDGAFLPAPGDTPRPPFHRLPRTLREVPATCPESDALSKDLKRRGFTFVGSTIMYAFMQAVGMVNDHVATCPAGAQIAAAKAK